MIEMGVLLVCSTIQGSKHILVPSEIYVRCYQIDIFIIIVQFYVDSLLILQLLRLKCWIFGFKLTCVPGEN